MTPLLPDPFGPEIVNFSLRKFKVELSNASHFFDMDGFELDHLRSPSAVSEKIFTNSSGLGFLLSASNLRSCSIFSMSTSLDAASFARNFSAICRRRVTIRVAPRLPFRLSAQYAPRNRSPLKWMRCEGASMHQTAAYRAMSRRSASSPTLIWCLHSETGLRPSRRIHTVLKGAFRKRNV